MKSFHEERKGIVKRRILSLSILFLLVLESLAFGQNHRASIRGSLNDASRARLSGALIKLIFADTNDTRTTTSGDNGEFAIYSLAPGS